MPTFIDDARIRFGEPHTRFKCGIMDGVEVVRLITASGVTQYHLRCCTEHRPHGPVFSKLLTARERKNSIIFRDNTGMYHYKPCQRCGDPNSEHHHWAPRKLFKDADEWPMGYLCQVCHRKWHQVMNGR
jgi:hypothetical protein